MNCGDHEHQCRRRACEGGEGSPGEECRPHCLDRTQERSWANRSASSEPNDAAADAGTILISPTRPTATAPPSS